MFPLVAGSVLWNLLVFGVGAVLLAVGFRAYRFGQVVRNTPTAKPGSVAAGRAEVQGTARPASDPIEAPFTGEEALCLDWTVEERVRDGGEDQWVERAAETRVEPFYLDGASGRVLVCADEHPDVEQLPWEYDSRRFTAGESDRVEQFLATHRDERDGNPATTVDPSTRENPATTDRPDDDSGFAPDEDRWRYVVRLLPPGTDLYVFGSLEPHRGEIGFVPDETTGRFVLNRTSEKWTAATQYWLGLLALSAGLLFVLWGGALATGVFSESLLVL